MNKKLLSVLLLFNLTVSFPLYGDYPVIKQTNIFSDPNFIQQQNDISIFYQTTGSFDQLPELMFFRFNLDRDYSIYSLAAAFNLPYDTLATLNNIEHPHELQDRDYIIVPNQPGIFISKSSLYSELNDFLKLTDRRNLHSADIVIRKDSAIYQYVFYPGENFTPQERDFFLKALFSPPITSEGITSRFGYRIDPFTSEWSLHAGLDLRADTGTSVFPARNGVVTEIGYSSVYGHYVIIGHDLGYTTFYAHLSSILAEEGDSVSKQTVIGESGNSGQSTGPHLHFEIRKNGNPVDPALYLTRGF